MPFSLKDMKIVILDDEEVQIVLLESILKRAGFQNLYSFSEPIEILDVFGREQPDLLLLDLNMPRVGGLEVIRLLRHHVSSEIFFPIMVLTAECSPKVREEVLVAGAKEFVTKPFDVADVLLRIQHLLQLRFISLRRQRRKEIIERYDQEDVKQDDGT